MTAHADLLDQRERLGGSFWGSIAFHVSLAALILGYSWIRPSHVVQWGDPTGGGGIGSAVTVSPTAKIPLPMPVAPANPVANPTESEVPPAPSKTPPRKQVLAPVKDAIPLPSRNAKKLKDIPLRDIPPAAVPNKYADAHPAAKDQLTSTYGQRLSSPMYGAQGGNGPGAINTPFGTQLGNYAALIRDRISQNWNTSDIDPRVRTLPEAVIGFTMRRNGSLVSGSVKVAQSSGNYQMDVSAQRAVMAAAPFPPIPAEYTKESADIELHFQLRR